MVDLLDRVPGVPFCPSPNHSSRERRKIVGLIVHYTAWGAGRGTASWLRNPGSKCSAHFVVSRDGFGEQLVPLNRAAWHAGVSEAPYFDEMESDANLFTIGVELANYGRLIEDRQGGLWVREGQKQLRFRGAAQEATLIFDSGKDVPGFWEEYTEKQVFWLESLMTLLAEAGYDLYMMGHEEVAMELGRKTDPGPLFPWGRFERWRKHPRRTESVV
jgi:N-acetylmuramoyl-L-alanine amidase